MGVIARNERRRSNLDRNKCKSRIDHKFYFFYVVKKKEQKYVCEKKKQIIIERYRRRYF